jgi:hypothetical protein
MESRRSYRRRVLALNRKLRKTLRRVVCRLLNCIYGLLLQWAKWWWWGQRSRLLDRLRGSLHDA